MLVHGLLVIIGVSAGACCRVNHDPEGSAVVVRWAFFLSCHALSLVWQIWRAVFALVAGDRDRAPQRLPEGPRFLSIGSKGELVGLKKLPRVPPLPEVQTVGFAGCANLCMYTAGAAYALQQAPNFEEQQRAGRLRARGGSSGAFVATAFATGCNMADFMLACHREFYLHRRRFGGCVGTYSACVGKILATAFREARRPFVGGRVELKGGLEVSVTRFNPWPEHVVVSEFYEEKTLIDVVLASCYIPVAYESPKMLPQFGFCIDGCAVHFLPEAQLVASPYHCHNADIAPEHEYPRELVFNLLHGDDVLRLFEDGYVDTVRWLEQGGNSQLFQRQEAAAEAGASTRTLVREGWRCIREIFVGPAKAKSS